MSNNKAQFLPPDIGSPLSKERKSALWVNTFSETASHRVTSSTHTFPLTFDLLFFLKVWRRKEKNKLVPEQIYF